MKPYTIINLPNLSDEDSNFSSPSPSSYSPSPLQSPHGSLSRQTSFSQFSTFSTSSIASLKNNLKETLDDWKPWMNHRFDADDNLDYGLLSNCCSYGYLGFFVVGFLLLLSIFLGSLWIISQHQKPVVFVESITFDRIYIQGVGVDARGFVTSMGSVNSYVKLNFKNTATFFGVHVTSISLQLNYHGLILASGNIPMFYQPRKIERSIQVMVNGSKIPLYGAATNLNIRHNGQPLEPIPLTLSVIVRSKANVLWTLVNPKFNKKIDCSFIVDPKRMSVTVSLTDKCTQSLLS